MLFNLFLTSKVSNNCCFSEIEVFKWDEILSAILDAFFNFFKLYDAQHYYGYARGLPHDDYNVNSYHPSNFYYADAHDCDAPHGLHVHVHARAYAYF